MKDQLLVKFFGVFLFVWLSLSLCAQNRDSIGVGTVSYVSKLHIYVKFTSTKGLERGDTLYFDSSCTQPALIVINTSSTTAICDPIYLERSQFQKNTPIYGIFKVKQENVGVQQPRIVVSPDDNTELQRARGVRKRSLRSRPRYSGRITLSSNSYFSEGTFSSNPGRHRMRSTFTFRGYHMHHMPLFVDVYGGTDYTLGPLESEPFGSDNVRLYRAYARYEGRSFDCALGRVMNRQVPAYGVVDGLQLAGKWNHWSLGTVLGFIPDYRSVRIHTDLSLMGLYLSFNRQDSVYRNVHMGIFEQRYRGRTDRRFLYLQYYGQILPRMNVYAAGEFDLYEIVQQQAQSIFRLTNAYVNVSYYISRRWNLSLGYDNRRNIIYYEQWRDLPIGDFYDYHRQGYFFRMGFRPLRRMHISATTRWNFEKTMQTPESRYLNLTAAYTRVPLIGARVSVSYGLSENRYLSSAFLTARLSRSFFRHRLSLQLLYRRYQNRYLRAELSPSIRQTYGLSANFRLVRRVYLTSYYQWNTSGFGRSHRLHLRVSYRYL